MELTTRSVMTLGDGWHCDQQQRGLYLQVSGGGAGRSWVFRFVMNGKQQYMGLGSIADVTLAEAREKALAARKLKLDGINPLEERHRQKQARIAERAKAITFKNCAEQYLKLHLDSFGNAKHRRQWIDTLAKYTYPKIGGMTVADITPADVLRCVEPIWIEKQVTASRILQRVSRIFDYAVARQYRADNPAAHVTEALPRPKNGNAHHAAMPYAGLPAFMAELRARKSVAAPALEFLILTAARSGEVLGAEWSEIDLKAKTWTIPASRMKAGNEHRVPLCERAVAILKARDRTEKPFSIGTAGMARECPDVTVHGFRATFKTWATECTNYPNDVVEQALAHTIGSAVERAYRRGDLYTKRSKLMAMWGQYCDKPISGQ